MEIGLGLPHLGHFADPDATRAVAIAAEDAGFAVALGDGPAALARRPPLLRLPRTGRRGPARTSSSGCSTRSSPSPWPLRSPIGSASAPTCSSRPGTRRSSSPAASPPSTR